MSSSEVQLAVYDLSRGMARSMSQAILGQRIDGIWHTGVVVFGKEYFFGGGIQAMPWGTFAAMNSLQPAEVQTLGRTSKSQFELEQYLRSISHQYTQATYDLIRHNCNNFSDTVCKFLLGHGIPSHIVDLPRIVFSTPGGAMLRPMIESMQNNVRQQQGYGLDPFSQAPQGAPQAAPSQPFESALTDSMVSLVENQVVQAQSAAKMAELEENAWVSTDATSVGALSNKILNLAAPNDVAGSALSTEEKDRLRAISRKLSPLSGPSFSIDDYALLESILTRHPEAHLACLFMLRLMFLHDQSTNFHEIALIRQLVQRLLAKEGAEAVSQPGRVTGFATIPAHVMALCAIGNLLSHQNGLALLGGRQSAAADEQKAAEMAEAASLSPNASESDAGQLFNDMVDVVLAGLSHGRAEVRQMSATLGYNLTLACTKDGQLSGPWKASASSSGEGAVELNGQALQLLCGCLEGLHEEKDELVCKRRLATSCRILRAFGTSASQLVKDLGMDAALYTMKSRPLPENSKALVEEMLSYM